ncbi:MAG: UDP-diphosphatase [Deltaproteobacteria bacterium RIFOXYA12_FULL_58_15]|nr:MAG: UDP-diphosphatase [Deltaproteobacteria bacterium RIFOXYA12_FULL_58_15]OGR13855.1 MAG: UDP-diphosphatase [Deltaproteobacteria bacterium RIFOXYB12_FULL_58_9]
MSLFEAFILGIIQGLTEFLPVSSSGHLEIAKAIFGDGSVPEESLLMTVVLHSATALSTLIVFRKDIGAIVKGLVGRKREDVAFTAKIVLSMVPAAVVGVMFNDQIESFFGGRLLLVGCMLLVTATLLVFADRAKTTLTDVGFVHAFVVGVSQAIAILPGISRSGATISTFVLLGIDRAKAARFSFLMVVPLIFGKMAKDILDGAFSDMGSTGALPYIVGFVAAFATGVVACRWMIKLVRNAHLTWFAVYCLIVGIAAIIFGA